MNKPRLNFIIDAVMFLIMIALAGIGLLMKFVLIPGRERWAKYGRQVDLYLFGWDRHDWGSVHFYLALALLGVLILHLILHWQMIVTLFQRLIPMPRTRAVVLWVFLLVSLLLIYFPFLITPKVEDVGRGRGRGWHHSSLEERLLPPGPGPAGAPADPAKTARTFSPQIGAPRASQL